MSTSLHSLKVARSHDVSPTAKATKPARISFATDDEMEAAMRDHASRLGMTVSQFMEMVARAHLASKIDLRRLPSIVAAIEHLRNDVQRFIADGRFDQDELREFFFHYAEISEMARKLAS